MNKDMLFEKFVKLYSQCDILNHILFIGSNGKQTIQKVYSCAALNKMEESKSTQEVFAQCIDSLLDLIKEFNIQGEIKINVSIKVFTVREGPSWHKKILK